MGRGRRNPRPAASAEPPSDRIEQLELSFASTETSIAATILSYAALTTQELLAAFGTVRRSQGGQGTTTDQQQDILRSMLVFSMAGLDACLKQLIRDALPSLALKSVGVQRQLDDFVSRKISRDGVAVDARFLARVLRSQDAQTALVSELISELTGGSLQSVQQLLSVCGAFDLSNDQGLVIELRGLAEAFTIRNRIIHEMDMNLAARNRNRTSRARGTMVRESNRTLRAAHRIVSAVDMRLQEPGDAQ